MALCFEDWGLVDYSEALRRQEAYVEEVYRGNRSATVVFCSHPPIVTKGRGTLAEDITDWTGAVAEINRGGRATYHGPSQIVIYPIISLQEGSEHRKARDVGSFLRQFEQAIVDVLGDLGIKAQGKSYQPKGTSEANKEETGVWVGNKKVASLGLSIRHWISFHGAALNVEFDPNAFKGLLPCGFQPSVMITVEELLGTSPDRTFIFDRLKIRLQERL
jgi:lipoyl(octanoyl) transferase